MYKLWLTHKHLTAKEKTQPRDTRTIYRHIITYTQLKNRINTSHETRIGSLNSQRILYTKIITKFTKDLKYIYNLTYKSIFNETTTK